MSFSADWRVTLLILKQFEVPIVRRFTPWRSFEAVEFATLEWVDWFNHSRLLEPIGNIPPAEAEARFYARLNDLKIAA